MADLTNDAILKLQAAGLSNSQIHKIRMSGSLNESGPNGDTRVEVDKQGNVRLIAISNKRVVSGTDGLATGEGFKRAEAILGADFDGDGVVGDGTSVQSSAPASERFTPHTVHQEPSSSTPVSSASSSPFLSQQGTQSSRSGFGVLAVALLVIVACSYYLWHTYA